MTTDRLAFEGRLARRLDVHASAVVAPFDPRAVARQAVETAQSHRGLRAWVDRLLRPDAMPVGRPATAGVLALAVLVVILAASILLVGTRPSDPTPPLDWPDLQLRATGSLVVPRACHSAVLLDDERVLVVGGRDAEGAAVTIPELYDPATGTFRALDGATVAGDGASATRLTDGRVLIAGGRGPLPATEGPAGCTLYRDDLPATQEVGAAFLFDPRTERVEPTGELQTPRSGHVAVLLHDGRVLIAGGNGEREDGTHDSLDSAELYDPATGTFQATGRMSVARGWMRGLGGGMAPTAVALADGHVVVSGGSEATDEADPEDVLTSDDAYDPGTGRFTRIRAGDPPPSQGPWMIHPNCRVPCLYRFDPVTFRRSAAWEGRLDVVGDDAPGYGRRVPREWLNGGSTWLLEGDRMLLVTGAKVSLLDLAAGEARSLDSVVSEYRRSATATALADGRVLIAGGTDVVSDEGPSIVTAAAEIAGSPRAATSLEKPGGATEPWIVYQGGERLDGSWPIRLVRPDGTGAHLLPFGDLPGYDQAHPAWSPDGERIAFDLFTKVPGSPDAVSIWVVGPDGGDPTELAACELPCLQLAYPAWSPDGTELALARYDIEPDGTWGRNAIEVLDVASGERRVLTETADGTTAVWTPRWSPDGSAVVFALETYTDATAETATSSVLATIPTDGSSTTPTVLTSTDTVADSPDWAPNERIAFTLSPSFAQRPDSSTIATIASDGSDLRVFDSADTGLPLAFEPTWTPDGQLLVGVGDSATGVQWLASIDPATGSAERLPWDLVTARPGIQRAHHHLRPAR